MSDDQSRLWRAEIAALEADQEALKQDIEPITRLAQALKDYEGVRAEGVARNRSRSD